MGKKVKIIVDVTELGRKGGQARAASLSPEEQTEHARKAVKAKWEKYYADHPEKLKAKLEREAGDRAPKKRGK